MNKKICEFCDYSGKLTGEHAWPNWLNKILPKDDLRKNHTHLFIKPPNVFNLNPAVRKRIISGSPGSRKIPIACSRCNNGWMSNLQERAKPCLSRLVSGEWVNIGESREDLVKWCVMTCMVYEFHDPETVSITKMDRNEFRVTGAVSERWSVFIGRQPSESPDRRGAHRAYGISSLENSYSNAPNSHATSLHVGGLLIQLIFCPEYIYPRSLAAYAKNNSLRLIHPVVSPLLDEAPQAWTSPRIEAPQAKLTEFLENFINHGVFPYLDDDEIHW
jgi:hypothetical protein